MKRLHNPHIDSLKGQLMKLEVTLYLKNILFTLKNPNLSC